MEKLTKTCEDYEKLKTKLLEVEEKLHKTTQELENADSRIAELEKEFKQEKEKHLKQRKRLLLGSVAYNFIEAVCQHVFQTPRRIHYARNICEKLTAFDDGDFEFKGTEKQRWEELKKDFTIDQNMLDVIAALASNRVDDAHPINLDESGEEEEPAKPKELTDIIDQLYQGHKKKEFRSQAHKLIGKLDALKRQLNKPLLE